MQSDTFVRVLAGTMVLLSVALAHFVSPWWLLLTCVVAVNLIQSAFTGWCLPELLARRTGLLKAESCIRKSSSGPEPLPR